MESGRSQTPVPSVTSRRELRGRAPRAVAPAPTLPAWLPRAAVLVALAAATIAVPVLDAVAPGPAAADVVIANGYPSAHEVLSGSVLLETPTSLLAAAPEAERVSDTPSRSLERSPLPDCDGEARVGSSNGQIPESDMCTLWDGSNMLRGDAAVALAGLHENFRVAFGRDLCITDSYRSLGAQRRVAALRGGLAATPGTSNHGWGLAIDLCSAETRSSAVIGWLFDNAPVYGWENPPWAQRGGSGPYEPWHWEYVPGTVQMGTDWSRD